MHNSLSSISQQSASAAGKGINAALSVGQYASSSAQQGLDAASYLGQTALSTARQGLGAASYLGQSALSATEKGFDIAASSAEQARQYALSRTPYSTTTDSKSVVSPLDKIYNSIESNRYYEEYVDILTRMFTILPSADVRDPTIDIRSWPVNDKGHIEMEHFPKPLERSYNEYSTINKIDFPQYLRNCQPIGGFKSDTKYLSYDDKGNPKEGNPQSIFKRLALIAKNNLVAISEAGILTPKLYNNIMIDCINEEFGDKKFKNPDIMKCLKFCRYKNNQYAFDDTGFISGVLNENDTEFINKVTTNCKFIESNGIIILNCHLDSRGPLKFKPTDITESDKNDNPGKLNWQIKVIKILSELESLSQGLGIPDIIVGDTNITVSKSCLKTDNEKIDRNTLLECIIEGITKKYPPNSSQPQSTEPQSTEPQSSKINKCWILITSSAKIDKIRSGFLLLNHQMNKANKKETIEEDGTIIAIRIDRAKLVDITPEYCDSHFGKNWHVCYENETLNTYTHMFSNSGIIVKFLNFTQLDDCITDNKPNDDIFIDHSIVSISKNAILNLMNINSGESQSKWINLVALNLGSIINSNNPWIIKLLMGDTLTKIEIADRWLFTKIVSELKSNKINQKILTEYPFNFDYDSYYGPNFGKLLFTREMINSFAKIMSTVHLYLQNMIFEPKSTGGYRTKKTRKLKKYKINTKKRKVKNKITITHKMNKHKTYKQ